jgi:thiol-disulfide isomerase/thioredoxin
MRRRSIVSVASLVSLAALSAAWLRPARAGQATCSSPGLPLGAVATGELLPGRLTLNLTTGLLPIRSEETLGEAQGPVRYDTRLIFLEQRFAAEYAVRPWLAVTAAMSYRMIDVTVDRELSSGADVLSPSIHVRTERLHGPGDPSLGLHLAYELGGLRLHGRAGVNLPLGRTEPNPHVLGSLGQEHQHLQLGAGTVIPFAALEVQAPITPRLTVAGWALLQPSLYEGAEGYRAGNRTSGGLTAAAALGARAWTLGLAVEGHGETAERWNGTVYRDEGNAGRLDVLAGGNATWRPTRRVAVTADLKYAVYSRVEGTQLSYGAVGSLGVAVTFELARRPSWRGLDHREAGPAGSAAELVPVPGKITVFDLWAQWCAPCRELDERLAALAAAHPERLAVRKLDVVDPESPAWRRYLAPGASALPHVKVYGADGALLFERTAPPAELARAIEALLR